ncbi:hypothetical protein GWI34_05175 [Actinomadura sp. DSM 109109]|nr:hypothetical protein [Actinomadura lepetitiana]
MTDLRAAVGRADPGTVDAIVVPTITPRRLGPAIALAKALESTIVLLCNTPSQRREIGMMDLPAGARCLEVGPHFRHPLLDFERRPADKHTNIAAKRNIGLLLARLCGWRTVFFLDDDIRGLDPSRVARAAALTGRYPVIGFQVPDFPDNSVVCHANRVSGGAQETFIGGNALLVDTRRAGAYFPPIYNEDWLFIYDTVAAGSAGTAGGVRQLVYDPFARSAVPEEFGEVIAEGLVRALHSGSDVSALSFWTDAIKKRSRFIEEVADRLRAPADGAPVQDAERMLRRLDEARKRLLEISPTECLSFYRAWCQNKGFWQRQLLGLPTSLTPDQAIRYLRMPNA